MKATRTLGLGWTALVALVSGACAAETADDAAAATEASVLRVTQSVMLDEGGARLLRTSLDGMHFARVRVLGASAEAREQVAASAEVVTAQIAGDKPRDLPTFAGGSARGAEGLVHGQVLFATCDGCVDTVSVRSNGLDQALPVHTTIELVSCNDLWRGVPSFVGEEDAREACAAAVDWAIESGAFDILGDTVPR